MSDMADALRRANDQRAELRRWDHITTEPAGPARTGREQRIMNEHTQTVEVGDQFQDNDPRLPSPRIVKVVEVGPTRAVVETVEHWNAHAKGRKTRVLLDRLQHGRDRQTGYTKVSR